MTCCRYFLHKQVAHLFFFSRFRTWKAFRLWRATIVREKAAAVRRHLCDSLLPLNARFATVLLQVAAECAALSAGAQLLPLPAGVAQSLADFQVCPSLSQSSFRPSNNTKIFHMPVLMMRSPPRAPSYEPQCCGAAHGLLSSAVGNAGRGTQSRKLRCSCLQ